MTRGLVHAAFRVTGHLAPRLLASALMFGSLPSCSPPPEPARTIRVGHMPSGASCHIGSADLSLRVSVDEVSGAPVGFEPGSAAGADLTVGFSPDTSSTRTTTVRLTNRSSRALKVDLWLSQNGERFTYTSSCPIPAGHQSLETWPGEVPWVYVSNPRFLAEPRSTACE
jgi:hypothetical protein